MKELDIKISKEQLIADRAEVTGFIEQLESTIEQINNGNLDKYKYWRHGNCEGIVSYRSDILRSSNSMLSDLNHLRSGINRKIGELVE